MKKAQTINFLFGYLIVFSKTKFFLNKQECILSNPMINNGFERLVGANFVMDDPCAAHRNCWGIVGKYGGEGGRWVDTG